MELLIYIIGIFAYFYLYLYSMQNYSLIKSQLLKALIQKNVKCFIPYLLQENVKTDFPHKLNFYLYLKFLIKSIPEECKRLDFQIEKSAIGVEGESDYNFYDDKYKTHQFTVTIRELEFYVHISCRPF